MNRAVAAALALAVVLADGCDAIIGVPDATLSPHLTCTGQSCTCDAPYTFCSATFEGACDVDLESDPHNCGRCGHDCLGGTCAPPGTCQPIVIDSATQPLGLSLYDGLLWLGLCAGNFPTSAVVTESTAGGSPKAAIMASECADVQQLVGDTLYWGSTAHLFASKLDPVTTPTTLAPGNAWTIGVNATHLYWGGLDAVGNDIGIFRMTLPAGVPEQLYASPTGGLDATANGVYWITQADGIHFVADSGSVDTLFSPHPGDFLLGDATNLYYSDNSGLYVLPIAGGTPKLLAANGSMAAAFLDGQDLFWLDDGTSEVEHVSISGGPVTVLAKNFSFCSNVGIAADAKAVYWLAGTVVAKVAR